MKAKTVIMLVASILLLARVFAASHAEFTDLGDGLLMRADGSVVAAWELPGCEAEGDSFNVDDGSLSGLPASKGAWQVRFERGW